MIRSLALTTSETLLREMFDACGAVHSCAWSMDQKSGMSKRFGFAEIPAPEAVLREPLPA